MVTFLADSDVLIDFLRGRQPGRGFIERAIANGEVAASPISRFELMGGANLDEEIAAVDALFELLTTWLFDSEAADVAGRIDRGLMATGVRLATGDTLLAGVAVSRAVPLLTRNRRHFERIPDLELMPI